jgi:DNA transposition AAA+ family ATPase
MDTRKTDAEELVELAGRVHAWQQAQGRSAAQMIRDYPGLGSDKTYGRLREGKTEEYDVEAQLAAYRAVWATIEATAAPAAREPVCHDLSPVVQLRRAALEAMRAEGSARVVLLEGPSGIGKSVAVGALLERYRQRVAVVEASDAWGDSPTALLGALLRALGVGDVPSGRAELLLRAVEALGRSRRCTVVEEAHHLGKRCLNTLKTLVNQTPGEFVLVAIPTLWSRLEGAAYQEARQLTTNRLSERVRLHLHEADIVRYMAAYPFAQRPDAATLKAAAKLARPVAEAHGNMAFVRDFARIAAQLAGEEAPAVQTFADAAQAAQRRR